MAKMQISVWTRGKAKDRGAHHGSGGYYNKIYAIAAFLALNWPRPRAEFAFDTDGEQEVASRLRMFDMLVTGRIPMLAYHFPWPGLGYVAKQGNAYRYHLAALRTVM